MITYIFGKGSNYLKIGAALNGYICRHFDILCISEVIKNLNIY